MTNSVHHVYEDYYKKALTMACIQIILMDKWRNEVESRGAQGKRGTFSEERGTFDHVVAYNEKKKWGGCAETSLV